MVRRPRVWHAKLLAPVEEQATAGLLAAVLATVAEGVTMAVRAPDAAAGDLARAAAALLALHLPLGWLLGLAVGLVVALVRDTWWLGWLRRGLVGLLSPRRRPDAFAAVLSLAAGALAFLYGAHRALAFFETHFHAAALIHAASVASLPFVLLGAIVAAAGVFAVTRRVAPWLGPFASSLSALGLLTGGVGALALRFGPRLAQWTQGLDPLPYLWPLGVGGVYLVAAALVRRLSPAWHRASWWLAAASLLALGWTGETYGRRQRVRHLVEGASAQGARLVRLYAELTDRDGDGFPAGFGGRDCDDGDPSVHPGANDPPGDGIDSDCFEGDGSPTLADLEGDGHYGRPPASLRRRNLLLITIDALRPDHLGTYGYERDTSPAIDAFAEDAVVFETVVAPSSRSVRSIPSMFMGVYPSQIAYGSEYLYPGVRPENDLLAEVAKRSGYGTRACIGTDYFHRVRDFFQGFDEVEQPRDPARDFPVDCALRSLERLEGEGRPFFLWVHLFNVHLPYLPDGVPSRFGDRPMDHYDTEITLADREVRRMLQALDARGLSGRTLVVLASDHGEAFMEHGYLGHSRTLFEEEVRSVLMVRGPGLAPRRVPAVVSLMDVAPTVRNLLDLPGRPRIPGRSLVPLMLGEEDGWPERPVFMELLPDGLFPYDQKAVRLGRWKLIWWLRDGRLRLSDLQADPHETRDVADDYPEQTQRLGVLLRSWMAGHRATNRRESVVAQHLRTRVPAMQHRVDARYPGFTFLGYDLPVTEVRRNQTLPMTFYYRVDHRIEDDLFFFVDLVGPGGLRFHDFHAHHYPLNGAFRTDEWEPGQIIVDPVEIYVPRDVPLGTFRVDFSVLDSERRPLPFGDEGRRSMTLGEVEVRAAQEPEPASMERAGSRRGRQEPRTPQAPASRQGPASRREPASRQAPASRRDPASRQEPL